MDSIEGEASDSVPELPHVDLVKTSLNPCSVESIQEAVPVFTVTIADANDDGTTSDRHVWPVMMACYELQEDGETRLGTLDLFAVKVPPDNVHTTDFGKPLSIMGKDDGPEPTSGILDGKWYTPASSSSSATVVADSDWWYATAHASGEVCLHSIRSSSTSSSSNTQTEADTFPFEAKFITKSQPIESSSGQHGLCLAVGWDQQQPASSSLSSSLSSSSSPRIASSYSHGHVAIHQYDAATQSLELQQSWHAHTLFAQHPAEVWSVSFVGPDPYSNMLLSGGDEGKLKVWDLRTISSGGGTPRPAHTLTDFTAGVTVLSPHPRMDHIVAAGSYDESVAIYDARNFSKPLCSHPSLGGGIWRLKWHPIDNDRLLVGAMHGGCRTVRMDGMLVDDEMAAAHGDVTIDIQSKFTKHESMAYGADWLYHLPSNKAEAKSVEFAASCSFYDRALYLWHTKPSSS